ncbi:DNA (cytosine-5-)-methyltransferase [Halorussus litoreus]|uniref:DNA (cytosine-5-)-methyltransferase n=1 Tax=Halorussus litoreus TaxID=1710536 RepID=UPI000E23423D|nr:DNA (cytosine-5-)-methyltransferase [Halorussus litoreus]
MPGTDAEGVAISADYHNKGHPEQEPIRFIDLFGGIGGFRLGLEQADDRYECVGYYDQDRFAVDSYNAIFGETHEPTDVTQLDAEQIPGHDLLCAGFPCQAFSLAGERGGFDDTRGTLFFEVARIARRKLPQVLLLENVKGLLNHADGATFRTILSTLDELGYDAEWQVLNSKYHGVPQNRERVFIVAYLRDGPRPQVFPIRGPAGEDIPRDGGTPIIDNNGRRRDYFKTISSGGNSAMDDSDADFILQQPRGDNDGRVRKTAPTVTSGGRYEQNNFVTGLVQSRGFETRQDDVSHAVKGDGGSSVVHATDGVCIRKLTPRECWRLQGFPDWAFEAAQEVNSDTQLYQQAGNAVTVNVIEVLGVRLLTAFK